MIHESSAHDDLHHLMPMLSALDFVLEGKRVDALGRHIPHIIDFDEIAPSFRYVDGFTSTGSPERTVA